MITLTRKEIHLFRAVARQALGITARRRAPSVAFIATPEGLLLRAQVAEFAVEYRLAGDYAPESFAVPYQALMECAGRRAEPVTLERQEHQILVRWNDGEVPQIAHYDTLEVEEFPSLPTTWHENGPELLTALRDAAETADAESSRYALGCLRLRGSDGQIAATDGRQLLVQSGFAFPWEGELLVPACRAFGHAAWATAGPVTVGKTESHVVLRSGAWTIFLGIAKEGRFPEVDSLTAAGPAATTLELTEMDAAFLARAINRLPVSETLNTPVTVDLNGKVAIRAHADGQPTATELVLRSSQRTGEELRFATNRRYLARAVTLGFREVQLTGPEQPACCHDERRTYLWALLGKASAVPPDVETVQIESPTRTTISRMPTMARRARRKRPDVSRSASTDRSPLAALIQEGETLCRRLQELLASLQTHSRPSTLREHQTLCT